MCACGDGGMKNMGKAGKSKCMSVDVHVIYICFVHAE